MLIAFAESEMSELSGRPCTGNRHSALTLIAATSLLMVPAVRAPLNWGSVDRNAGALNASLCYKLEWGGGAMAGIRPITGMPNSHPLVNGDVNCPGHQYTAGEAIPVTGYWNYNGNCNAMSAVEGAEMFYALGYPIGSSANTGYYAHDAAMMFMVEDEGGRMHLVLTLDDTNAQGDTTGGRLTLDVSTSPPQTTIDLELLDDRTEYNNNVVRSGATRYREWNSSAGRGSFHWAWGACCTDGMVLGPMPTTGFQMDLGRHLAISPRIWSSRFSQPTSPNISPSISPHISPHLIALCVCVRFPTAAGSDESRLSNSRRNRGIDKLSFATWLPDSSGVSFIDVPFAEAMSNPLRVGAFTCSDFCASLSSCGTCTATEFCGWCGPADGGECLPYTQSSVCSMISQPWTPPNTCCAACTALDADEEACISMEGCGYVGA